MTTVSQAMITTLEPSPPAVQTTVSEVDNNNEALFRKLLMGVSVMAGMYYRLVVQSEQQLRDMATTDPLTRLRESIAELKLPSNNGPLSVTMTFGVCTLPSTSPSSTPLPAQTRPCMTASMVAATGWRWRRMICPDTPDLAREYPPS
jgi:hypothetical protein